MCLVGEGEEGVTEALCQEDPAAVDVVEAHDGVLAEGRGADPQVDRDVEDGAERAVDVLRLAGRHVGEVDPAHRAAPGDGVVGLHRREPVPGHGGELVAAEPLQEAAAVVAEHARRGDVGVGELQRRNVHGVTLSRAYSRRTRERRWSDALSSHRTREVAVR